MTNNLIVPFFVASFESFLKEFFVAYLDTHTDLQSKVFDRRKRFDAETVQALLGKKKTLAEVEASNFTFQNVASANAAFAEYVGLDLYKLWRCKRKFRGKYHLILDVLEELINLRHQIVHSATLDQHLYMEKIERYGHFLRSAAERLVSHLQEERQFRIDLEEFL